MADKIIKLVYEPHSCILEISDVNSIEEIRKTVGQIQSITGHAFKHNILDFAYCHHGSGIFVC